MRPSWVTTLLASTALASGGIALSETTGSHQPLRSEAVLAAPDEPGAPLVIEGRVLGALGRPVRNARVWVYHADTHGKYVRYDRTPRQLGGMLRTDVLGGYRIRTILPGPAEGVPHVHMLIEQSPTDYRMGTVNLCRRFGAGSDTEFARLPQMLELPNAASWRYVRQDSVGVFHCTWDPQAELGPRMEETPGAFARRP
jgi:hypothetical protein